jgi:beta-phosphoglucomutase
MMKIDKYMAIIFDFDGVIARTMDDNYEAWKRTFLEYGIALERQEYFLIEGLSSKEVARHFLPTEHHDDETLKMAAKKKDNYYLENNRFSFYDGVPELLRMIKSAGKRIGLVSGASGSRLKNTVTEEFARLFDVIVTADMCENCKPDPEPYLMAAAVLQIEPEACLAIENAPSGIASAKSAGMTCIAVASTVGSEHLKNADAIINRIIELKDMLFVEQKGKCLYEQ